MSLKYEPSSEPFASTRKWMGSWRCAIKKCDCLYLPNLCDTNKCGMRDRVQSLARAAGAPRSVRAGYVQSSDPLKVDGVIAMCVFRMSRRCWCSLSSRLYRGTSHIRNSAPVGPCSSPMPRTCGDPMGGGASYERDTPVAFALQLYLPVSHLVRISGYYRSSLCHVCDRQVSHVVTKV